MSSENRGNGPTQPPVFTVHPGYKHNVNYGFQQDPPPYDHVVYGIPVEQCHPSQTAPQTTGIVFVAPVQTYSSTARIIQYFCSFLFIIFILSVALPLIFKGK